MKHIEAIKSPGLQFRHELKYLITPGDAELLKLRLGAIMRLDAKAEETGGYKVRSLYFDDLWNSAYEEKLMGVVSRCKYRIRIYNDSDKSINLERKLKRGNYIAKQSAALTRDEAEMLIGGEYGFLLNNPQQLCREFYYECTTRLMRPRVIVDYERIPYTMPVGDVRITFDMDVRAALLSFDIFDPKLPALGVLEHGNMILEVKFTGLLPGILKKALPQRASQVLSASKYVLACDKVKFLSHMGQCN